jgi:hypothetical protein
MSKAKTRQDCERLCKKYLYDLTTFIGENRRPDWNQVYRTILLNIAGLKYGRRL